MANVWEKAKSILAGNLNSGLSYLITTVKRVHCTAGLYYKDFGLLVYAPIERASTTFINYGIQKGYNIPKEWKSYKKSQGTTKGT